MGVNLDSGGLLASSSAFPLLLAACVLPSSIGLWRSGYTVSLGYAAAMGISGAIALLSTTAVQHGGGWTLSALHGVGFLLFGLRLFLFLLWRQVTIPHFHQNTLRSESKAPSNRLMRLPMILSCAFLFLGLASPLVLSARYGGRNRLPDLIGTIGIVIMYLGGLVEAVGDVQKTTQKAGHPQKRETPQEAPPSSSSAAGPPPLPPPGKWVDQGLYAFLRHPNYQGEQFMWLGSFLAGIAPAGPYLIGRTGEGRPWPWVLGSFLGLCGILFILTMATTGLERKQMEIYGKDPAFLAYRKRTWGGFTRPAKTKEAASSPISKSS